MASDNGRQFENQLVLTVLKEVAKGIAANYDSFHQILEKTWKIYSEFYESLRKMVERFEGEYMGCCNRLITVFEEGMQYFDGVRESLKLLEIQLDLIKQQIELNPPNYSTIGDLVSQLNKCISRIQEFQSEFSKRCEGAIAGANETAIECEDLAAKAQMAKRTAQAVGFGFSIAGGVLVGALTAGIGTVIAGVAAGAATTAGGGIFTQYTWANDYEEVKKEFIELKKKLRALRQTSYELQEIVGNSKRIAEKLEPLTDTIDRLSTGGGRTRRNRRGLQEVSQSLLDEVKQINDEMDNSPPQENLEAAIKDHKRKASIELEGYTAGKKFKQS